MDRERTSSIDWEPKTLTLQQLKYAREAALSVVRTNTPEEAVRIFTEGLKPVHSAKSNSMDWADEEGDLFDSNARNHNSAIKRDVVSAPF